MRYQSYLTENNNVSTLINKLIGMGYAKARKELTKSSRALLQMLIDTGREKDVLLVINKHLKTNFKSYKDLNRQSRQVFEGIDSNGQMLNEDLKHFWGFLKTEAWPALSFYPILTLWLELDRILGGGDPNWKKIGVYATIWLFLISTRHISMFKKWKKSDQAQWEIEGRPTAFGKGPGVRPEVAKELSRAKTMMQHPTDSRTTGKLGFKLKS